MSIKLLTRITNYERHRQSIFVHVTTVESAAFLAQLKKAKHSASTLEKGLLSSCENKENKKEK